MSNELPLKKRIEDLERIEILNALKESEWVKARAARLLGMTERMFGYRLMKYGIRIHKEVYGQESHIEKS